MVIDTHYNFNIQYKKQLYFVFRREFYKKVIMIMKTCWEGYILSFDMLFYNDCVSWVKIFATKNPVVAIFLFIFTF